uniref:Transposase Tc1-like domain-containing protein n=1 Tax=Monopterus albus TaxID=43700 RepID=A0A3Q3KA92_MONAL
MKELVCPESDAHLDKQKQCCTHCASAKARRQHLGKSTSSKYDTGAVGVSLATVSRVIKMKKETGSVSPKRKGKCGRKRKTTPRDDAYLIRESVKDPRKTSDALKVDLKEKGIEVSSSTVRRRLLEVGRKAYRPVKKQLLTKAMKVKRYKWALKYKNWTKEDWRKVLFSDEKRCFCVVSEIRTLINTIPHKPKIFIRTA